MIAYQNLETYQNGNKEIWSDYAFDTYAFDLIQTELFAEQSK